MTRRCLSILPIPIFGNNAIVYSMSKKNILKMCSWVLAGLVMLLAVLVWAGERFGGPRLSVYDWFPLLGLLAFSLMWTHYILGSLRRYLNLGKDDNKLYMKTTGIFVLILILLHPGLLNFQLVSDGLGLPPGSYQATYPQTVQGAITLGTIGLLIFLVFELKKWFGKKTWWRFVEYGQIIAMVLIFYHGLTLGRELTVPWYRMIWIFYGVSFLLSIGYNYWQDKLSKGGSNETT